MSPEEKSAQYLDLNANQRLLEIQEEIVKIEKKRIYKELSDKQHEEAREKIKFLVKEEKSILEIRYSKQKDIKDAENAETRASKMDEDRLNKLFENESMENQRIEGDLKEIITATKTRIWYEKWWGKLIIIVVGAVIVSLLSNENIINLSGFIIE